MLGLFIFSLAGSVIFTRLFMFVAHKFRVYDYPEKRKIHSKPMPLLGGLAVYVSFVAALLLNFHFSWELKGMIVASSFVMISGLLDDINDLSASGRLIIQILCSLLVIAFGVRLKLVTDAFPYGAFIDGAITVLWIVGITNAINFLDGLDGLAAGLSLIISTTFFIIAYQTGQTYFAFLNIALAGACLGFLFYNFKPAKIFLGDAGSSFLGFSLAVLAVMGEWSADRPVVAFSIPLLVLAIPIFDVIYISVSRIAQGKVRSFREWIEYVGKDHLHHRLMGLGFTETQTVFIIYLINIVFALGVLVLKKADTTQALLLVAQGTFILVLITLLMIAGRGHLEKMEKSDGAKDLVS